MEKLFQRIEEACAAYYSKNLDDAGFYQVYDWIDQSLWSDKEFVLNILELDASTVIHIPDQLAADEEFRVYVEENIDLAWEIKGVPQEKIPQWIKDWIK